MRSFLLQRRHSWHAFSNAGTNDSKPQKRRRFSLVANVGSEGSRLFPPKNGRRFSLPFVPSTHRQSVNVGDVIYEEDSNSLIEDEEEHEIKRKTMKFDTAITGEHLTKLIVLTLFVCVVTVSAVSYSFYNVIQKPIW